MTYDLYIGDRTFSSWSLRGWLMLEKFGLPYRAHMLGLYAGTMAAEMAHLAPARLVPSIQTSDDIVISESLAIAETLHERHPDAGLWPQDPKARATARWLSAAMAAGFGDLRGECPMQLEHVFKGFNVSDAVQKDLKQIEALWAHARAVRQTDGDWLFGEYSVADAFYAPVAARIVGYDLPVSDAARAYCMTTLRDPAFKKWRNEGLKVTYDPYPYGAGLDRAPWPAD
jgi:glutathione S-transferase